ncbi:MAG TPA: rhodanese-like domain-containing protein [Saprospiraceae bacterium]|nr:rhodanese-like domain-containing protein [Saprospiraceae bacterium]HNM27340.1 rhodanese-like domain-containing protein [Saprospiraceae bacterium]
MRTALFYGTVLSVFLLVSCNRSQPADTNAPANPSSDGNTTGLTPDSAARHGAVPTSGTDDQDSGPAGRMVTGTGTTDPDSIIVWIDNKAFEQMVGNGTGVQLLDVQTPREFHHLHMGQATNIQFPSDDFDTQIRIFSKSLPVFVYCPSGIRSGDAAQRLKELGYKRIYVLQYGLRTWHKALYRTPPNMIPPQYR